MLMIRYYLLPFICCLPFLLFSQTDHIWTISFGSTGTDYGAGIVLDEAGNIYTVGRFAGTVDFDPGPNTVNLNAVGDTDIYVQKLDAAGNYVWAKSFGGVLEERGHAIDIDAAGNVYVTGNFRGAADFDPGPGTFTMTSPSSTDTDAFIVKLQADGTFGWAKQIGGVGTDWGHALVVDDAGNSYNTGYFSEVVDLDPGPGVDPATVPGIPIISDLYVVKLDTDGNYVWGHPIGGEGQERGYGITLDNNGDVYVTGQFGQTADFDPGPGVAMLTTGTTTVALDGFLLKLSPDGEYLWANNLGSSSDYDYAWSVKTDTENNVYYTGYFRGTVDMDPGPATFDVTSNGGRDAFLVKLGTDGDFRWARGMGGSGNEYSRTMVVNPANNDVYLVASQYTSTLANWGTAELVNEIEGLPGTQEVLVMASYDTDGEPLCAFPIATAQGGFYSAGFHSQMAIKNNELFFISNFSSPTTDYDPSSNQVFNPPFAGGAWDIALSRYALNPFSVSLGGNTFFCEGESTTLETGTSGANYSWQDGSSEPTYLVDTPGTYAVTVNDAGCVDRDEAFVIEIVVDDTVIQEEGVLTANAENVTYQWVDCADFSPIPGATNKVFTPTALGSYAVILGNSGCADTSDCVQLLMVDTEERFLPQLSVYPNPVGSSEFVTFSLDRFYNQLHVRIYSADGRLLREQQTAGQQFNLDTTDFPSGLLGIEVIADEQRLFCKLIN
ncbi:MAG: T9SS type A sorting domain-containing protein [Bacteroidota bacterium]